jgi:hypothetical protein
VDGSFVLYLSGSGYLHVQLVLLMAFREHTNQYSSVVNIKYKQVFWLKAF